MKTKAQPIPEADHTALCNHQWKDFGFIVVGDGTLGREVFARTRYKSEALTLAHGDSAMTVYAVTLLGGFELIYPPKLRN